MNKSKPKELLDPNSRTHTKLLQSWALWAVVKGRAVRILDAENLKSWKFVRCEVWSLKPQGWWREIQWVDIPEINLQKAIKNGTSWTHTRAIVWNGAWVWARDTVRIESYNPETHELNVIGQHSGEFTLTIPVTYSSFENIDNYTFDNTSLRANPTQPKDDTTIQHMRDFLKRNPPR